MALLFLDYDDENPQADDPDLAVALAIEVSDANVPVLDIKLFNR
jgi:hypothetical protein